MTQRVQTATAGFSSGAQINPAQLVQLRALARFLPLHRQRRILNDLAGTHASAIRGRGIDYAEVRAYQPGDDIRSMDWRVTARTGDAHIKVFREEKERPVILVCDLRAGMHFGTRRAFKSVLAADITALLGWAALEHGDRTGALLFTDDHETDLRPKTGRRQLLQLLSALPQLQPGETSAGRLQQICRHLRRVVRPGSAVYFISDFAGYNEDCERQLFSMTRHSDLISFYLSDPLEAELPPPGMYNIRHGEQQRLLDTADAGLRRQYHDAHEQQLNNLRQSMNRLRTPLTELSTADTDLLGILRQGLGLSAGGER